MRVVIASRSNLDGVSKSNFAPLLAETTVIDRYFGIPLLAKNISKNKVNQKVPTQVILISFVTQIETKLTKRS